MNRKTAFLLLTAALPAPGQVLISQYYEGTSNNKWVELQNTGSSTVSLAGYTLTLWTNANAENWKTGTGTPGAEFPLDSVTLAPGAHFLLGNSSAVLPSYAVSDASSGIANFNGNDSVVLYNGAVGDPSAIVDAVAFTNGGNEGANLSFYRLNGDVGFDTTPGTSLVTYPAVWGQKTNVEVDNAVPTDPFYLTALGTVGTLEISIDNTSVSESSGFGIATVTVTRVGGTSGELTVNVTSGDTSEAVVSGSTVVIADGEASGTIMLDAVDDSWPDGDQIVQITADSAGYDAVSTPLTVTDDATDEFSIVVNEVYYAVDANIQDANGDGVTNTSSPVLDEFVELYNPTGSDLDISGYSMFDSFGTIHLFPEGTVIPTGGALLVFGGGSVSEGSSSSFGGTPVQLSTNGGLFLNDNGTDRVTIRNAFDEEVFGLPLPDQTGSPDGGSLTLSTDGDASSGYVLHTSLTPSVLFSPGTKVDGSPFIAIADSLTLTVNTATALESTGALVAAVTVSIPSALTEDLSVTLTSSSEDDLLIDSPVVIPAGQTTVSVNGFTIDDLLPDADVEVTVTAIASGYLNASGIITIQDDGDTLPDVANLVITEIMFNPASDESSPVGEWVEIYNAGTTDADLTGYKLDDEDSSNWGSITGGILPAGKFAVIFDSDFTDEATFRTEWGVPADALLLGVSWGSLANSPGIGNEVLQLLDSYSRVIDEVDFDDDGTIWPVDDGAASTALLPSFMNSTDNDDGTNWVLSGVGSSSPTGPTFAVTDVGSPGYATPVDTTGGGYSDWETTNGVTLGPDGDDDADGIANLVEYALGLNPQTPDGSPGTFNGTLLSFTKGAEAVGNGDITYSIETSTDLGITDPWAPVTADVNDGSLISYTLPTGGGALFARLKVTQN